MQPTGETQRPRSAKRVSLGRVAWLAVCSLLLAPAPAGAAEGSPSPEVAPPSAAPTASAEAPTPDTPPQAAQTAPPPAAAVPSASAAPSPAGASTGASAPARQGARGRPRGDGARRPRHAGAVSSRQRVGLPEPHLAQVRGRLTPLVAPSLSPAPGHREGTLMLYAALALGLLSIAGASLLRMLWQLGQFGGLSHEGPVR